MKKLFVALLAFCSSQALADTWVRYDVTGAGTYEYLDAVSPENSKWGPAKFNATFYVEIDPRDPDGDWPMSDGYSYRRPTSDGNWEVANASGGDLKFYYYPEWCDTPCSNYSVTLTYAPGAFSGGLPDKLPKTLLGGDMNFTFGGHWILTDGSGAPVRATATIVDGHGDWFFGYTPLPVPEPSSWAIMLAGFGMVGGAMRADRRNEAKLRLI